MRQAYGEYDDHRTDDYGLAGEQRAEEAPPRDRRLPMVLLSVCLMALFSGGLYFAYVQGTHHPTAPAAKTGDGVPLLRADERPTKVRPDQPGGMSIPDQNVSLYNEKPGGPPVEKLLPAPEQPLPRPVPPPPAAPAISPPAADAAAPAPAGTLAPPATAQSPSKTAAKTPPAATAPAPVKQPPAAAAGRSGVQIRLGSLRSPEAAREEWTRLKHDNPDLLGKLSAVAIRTDLGEKGIYYRIQAGAFGDAAAAERLCNELKQRNLGCLLAR